MVEPVDVLFGVTTPGDQRNFVYEGTTTRGSGIDAAWTKLLVLYCYTYKHAPYVCTLWAKN